MEQKQLVERLEAVAQRLEAFEVSLVSKTGAVASGSSLAVSSSSVSKVVTPSKPNPANAASSTEAALQAFDDLLRSNVEPLAQLSSSLPEQVQQAVSCLVEGMKECRRVIEAAARRQKPDMTGLQELLKPMAVHMAAARKLTEGRRTPAYNSLMVVAELMQCLSWAAYTGPSCGMPPPSQFVGDSWQSADFYANKMLMEARQAGGQQSDVAIAWVKAMKDVVKALESYLVRHMPTGLVWGTLATATAAAGATATATTTPAVATATTTTTAPAAPVAKPAAPEPAPTPEAAPEAQPEAAALPPPPPQAGAGKGPGGPPPPPPPPPKPLTVEDFADSQQSSAGGAAAAGGGGGANALFSELAAKGTAGLRKVTDDMKAKNRGDRSGLVATPDTTAPAAPAAAKPSAGSKTLGPPRMEYDSNRKKWVVENQVGQKPLVLSDVQPNQAVYILNCKDCVIQITSKANAVSVDNCVKTGVVFADLISGCDAVNCKNCQLQCTGLVPTMSVENSDGVQVYVTKQTSQNPDFQLVTAKISEVNVHVLPEEGSDAETLEQPVPEQFVTTFDKDGNLVTKPAKHSSA